MLLLVLPACLCQGTRMPWYYRTDGTPPPPWYLRNVGVYSGQPYVMPQPPQQPYQQPQFVSYFSLCKSFCLKTWNDLLLICSSSLWKNFWFSGNFVMPLPEFGMRCQIPYKEFYLPCHYETSNENILNIFWTWFLSFSYYIISCSKTFYI